MIGGLIPPRAGRAFHLALSVALRGEEGVLTRALTVCLPGSAPDGSRLSRKPPANPNPPPPVKTEACAVRPYRADWYSGGVVCNLFGF